MHDACNFDVSKRIQFIVLLVVGYKMPKRTQRIIRSDTRHIRSAGSFSHWHIRMVQAYAPPTNRCNTHHFLKVRSEFGSKLPADAAQDGRCKKKKKGGEGKHPEATVQLYVAAPLLVRRRLAGCANEGSWI